MDFTGTPSYFNAHVALGNASTASVATTFPFAAPQLRLANFEAVDIYVNLRGTAATTADMLVRACSDLGLLTITNPTSQISSYTTSTSAADKLLRVTALG